MQFRFYNYVFKPTLLGSLITLLCIPLFIKLGLWQYHKAVLKQNIQIAFNQSEQLSNLGSDLIKNPEKYQYKKVKITGEYAAQYQILIDNQVEQSQAGFHVITPLKINGSEHYVLVNRGWIAGNANHTEIPVVDTPSGLVSVGGVLWLPSTKIFTLEDKTQVNDLSQPWQGVWQHLDMQKYQKTAPIQVLPLIIKLDSKSTAGGFVRNWQMPADRIATNLGYAYQWFGFAFATFAIYLYMSIKRIK
ncbi:MAG: SURF1 family protein [Methylotenera sp.]